MGVRGGRARLPIVMQSARACVGEWNGVE